MDAAPGMFPPPPRPELLAVAALHTQHPDLPIDRVDLAGSPGPHIALVRVPDRAAVHAWAKGLGTTVRRTGHSTYGTEYPDLDPPRLENWSWWRMTYTDTRAADDTPVRVYTIEVSDPHALHPELARPLAHHLERSVSGDTTRSLTAPRIVVICGSTRFMDQMADADRELTWSGHIVVRPGGDMKTPHPLWADPAEAAAGKVRLDDLHRAKIRMADEVLVVNPGSYIGESTRAEISYARALGKPVRFTETTVNPTYRPDGELNAPDSKPL
jgi:hypothetical protein